MGVFVCISCGLYTNIRRLFCVFIFALLLIALVLTRSPVFIFFPTLFLLSSCSRSLTHTKTHNIHNDMYQSSNSSLSVLFIYFFFLSCVVFRHFIAPLFYSVPYSLLILNTSFHTIGTKQFVKVDYSIKLSMRTFAKLMEVDKEITTTTATPTKKKNNRAYT